MSRFGEVLSRRKNLQPGRLKELLRQTQPRCLDCLEAARDDAGCGMRPTDGRPIETELLVDEDVPQLDFIAVDAGYLRDARDPAGPVPQPVEHDDEVDRRSDLVSTRPRWR